jgi:arylsulfatase A-like enzyme
MIYQATHPTHEPPMTPNAGAFKCRRGSSGGGRRFWLMLLSVAVVFSSLFAGAADTKPNILFILADDLGWGDLGCYGQKQIQTPNLDALTREGTRFTQVYSGASVCAPSRCVLMTGRHTGHAKVRGNGAMTGGEVFPEYGKARRAGLTTEDVTLPMVLKRAGYTTGITGKWGLGEAGTAGVPNAKGFDESFGYLNQDHAAEYYTDHLWKNGERVTLKGNLGGKRNEYTHDLFTEFALDFLKRHRAESFFLYLAWTLPHAEYVVPSLETYAGRNWPQKEKVHAAMVTRLDRDVGRILERLKELGLAENTIVFFASDNGAVARRDGLFDSAGPFRGQKGTQWEGGLRVPMLVRWPGRVPTGKVSDTPWYFADVLPTLCEIAGAASPGGVDGLSVLPVLHGGIPETLSQRPLYWEQHGKGGFWQTVRLANWKAHRFQEGDRVELYDLSSDPRESTDVSTQHPEIVQRLRTAMQATHTPSPNWPVTGEPKSK